MKVHNFLILILSLITQASLGQQQFTVSGYIKDTTDQGLMGANILLEDRAEGTISNEDGEYMLSLPKGEHVIQVSHLGYESTLLNLDLNENVRKDIILEASEEHLKEVVILQNGHRFYLSDPEMSVSQLNSETINDLPVVLGEVDVLKAITQLPGVTSSGDGTAGFQVRGGSADQNLVLLDGAPIFNTSHLFGFFSVFNNDAVHNVKLYKGAIPAEYGGRLASVLDITQKSGDHEKFKMNGGIGTISSRLLAEGPIIKDRTSFLIGGRSSYAHLFLKAVDNENSAYFYDINAKLDHRLNKNSSLHLSGYLGNDYFSMNEDFENIYGNKIMSLRWSHIFSDNLSSDLFLTYSDYDFNLNIKASEFESITGIKNLNFGYDWDLYLHSDLDLSFGLNGSAYRFNPGQIIPKGENSGLNYLKIEDKDALEAAAYLQVEQRVTSRINLSYGIRYSRFHRIGKANQFIYHKNEPVSFNRNLGIYEKSQPVGTRYYSSGENIKIYDNWEPRFSFAYTWEDQAIKLGYNRMSQYLHLLSNTLSPTPMDLWVPSDTHIRPQLLDQIAAGYYKEYGDYFLEMEIFAKKVRNRINYIDGANLVGNPAIEQVLLNGKGRAYGLEVFLKKSTGRLKGWLAYTWSKAEQKTPGRRTSETGINFGKWYNANHDRTHDLSLNANYKLSNKWRFATSFNFQTGRATSYPQGSYQYLDVNVPHFETRNAGRLPAYHRLDIAATYTPKPNKKNGWQSEWNFGIYNLYNRRNANSISFKQDRETGVNQAVRLSVFGVIPSITYNFKF